MVFSNKAVTIGFIFLCAFLFLLAMYLIYKPCMVSGYFKEPVCLGMVNNEIIGKYGKGNGTVAIKKGYMVYINYESGNNYITIMNIQGKLVPVWLPKESIVIK